MPTTLPVLTRTIDDAFVSTWYEIRAEAIDNVLNATVIWNALQGSGCFDTQEGQDFITRTIAVGQATAEQVAKGSVMTPSEPQLDTMAIWEWKYLAANIQRSTFTDQKNSGPYKIKDYVGRRLTAARDALEQKFETDINVAMQANETGMGIQGLNDMIPPIATLNGGGPFTFGRITRPASFTAVGKISRAAVGATNPWWSSVYLDGTLASIEADLLDDMKSLYNSVGNNQAFPNLIITTQAIFEVYETFAIDVSQIIKDETTRLADLGFEVLRFKGKPLIWAAGIATGTMFMLNTDWIEFIYDPNLWFDMTDWKPQPFEFDRAAQILCSGNLISTQLRRHGRALWD